MISSLLSKHATFKNQFITFNDFEVFNYCPFKNAPSEFFMKYNFGQNLVVAKYIFFWQKVPTIHLLDICCHLTLVSRSNLMCLAAKNA